MTNTNDKNNLHRYEEQQFLNEEQQTIQKILNDFKQPISSNYIRLKVEEGNYQFSTSSKWKDKPNYERYGFYLEEEEEKWVQIDISHNLVEKLEIEKGKDITYPFYLTIDIDQKKLVRGAYAIDNEEEIFIDKPVSEKNAEAELIKRLKELEKLREQVKELEDLKREKVSLEEKSRNLEKKVQEEQEKNDRLGEQIWEETRVKEELQELKNESKRSWKGFRQWLGDNFLDKNSYPSYFKRGLEKSYPFLSQQPSYLCGGFLGLYNNLQKHLGENYDPPMADWDRPDFVQFVFREYDKQKKFDELVFWRGQLSSSQVLSNIKEAAEFYKWSDATNYIKEINKLLEEYRQATSPQTTTE